MMALVDRALALNPSFARGWHISGVTQDIGRASPMSRSSMSKLAAPKPPRPHRHSAQL